MDSMTEKKIEIMGIHLFVKAVGIKPLASTTRIRVYSIGAERAACDQELQYSAIKYITIHPPPLPERDRFIIPP